MRSRFPIRFLVAATAAFLLLAVSSATPADTFALHVVSETSSTITLGWDPQPGYGYLFSADDKLVSRTNNPSRSQVTFAKATSYEVAVIVKGAIGNYPPPPPPEPLPICSDGLDNDNDGKVDFPADPGCLSATDTDETDVVVPPKPQCSDGQDNDGDGKIDYPADPGCSSATDSDETDPAAGNVVEMAGTVSAQALLQAIGNAPAGAVIVRPAAGQSSFTVTGDANFTRPNVTIQHANFPDLIQLADGSVVEDSQIHGVYVDGADNWTLQRNVLDGRCVYPQNFIYGASNWKILNNTVKNYNVGPLVNGRCTYTSANDVHSEGFYIGAGNDGGLIKGNQFMDNGTTGHIFFTWWGGDPNVRSTYPRNICVTNNSFVRSINGYYAIQIRSEFDGSENIDIDPSNTVDAGTALSTGFVRPC